MAHPDGQVGEEGQQHHHQGHPHHVHNFDLKRHAEHSNIDSADGPIGSHTQNSERSVLENCLNQCQLLLLLSELHLEILKLC